MMRIYEDQAIPLRVLTESDVEARIAAARKRRDETRTRVRETSVRIEKTICAHASADRSESPKAYPEAAPPDRFAQMRRLAFALPPEERSRAGVFYAQACFMADFELAETGADDEHDAAFYCPTPTYAEMTNLQLRTYFRWRTRIRHGERAKPPSPSYGFLYAYELIHLVGFKNEPRKAFEELIALKHLLEGAREEFSIFLACWIRDFAVYYGIPADAIPEDLLPPPPKERETPERIVMDTKCSDAERVTNFKTLCSYSIERLKSLNADPALFDDALIRIIRSLAEKHHCDSIGARSYLSALLGQVPSRIWRPFGFALFFEREPHKNVRYEHPNGDVYNCIGGRWQLEALDFERRKNPRIASILKRLDHLLSLSLFGKAGRSGREALAAPLESILKQAADDAMRVKRERLNPARSVDFGKLDGIRSDAAVTLARLIVEDGEDEQTEEALEAPTVSVVNIEVTAPPAAPREPDASTMNGNREATRDSSPQTAGFLLETSHNDIRGLLEEECRLLASLLNREGPDAVRDALGGLKLTAVRAVDSINEKLFDRVGDAVLETTGGLPVLVEDYEDNIRELLKDTQN